jgi:flagellar biosynthesis GTPase FlhF
MSSEFDLSTDIATIQARLNNAFDNIHDILEPSHCIVPSLEQQLKEQTQQLKEQTLQIKQMAEMMKSMMSLAMPLLEEKASKLRKEKEEKAEEEKAEEDRKRKEEDRKRKEEDRKRKEKVRIQKEEDRKHVEQIRKQEEKKCTWSWVGSQLCPDFDWSCPNDGNAYTWEHAYKSYLRTFEGYLWENNGYKFGKWVGKWDSQTKTIDTTYPEPEWDE